MELQTITRVFDAGDCLYEQTFTHMLKKENNMKLISWNVNGIRACVTKGFLTYFDEVDADFSVFKKQSARWDKLIYS